MTTFYTYVQVTRYRAAHADGAPRIKYRKPADRRSRPQRWRDAVAELVELQADYQTWLDALPENLADSATAEVTAGYRSLRSIRHAVSGGTS